VVQQWESKTYRTSQERVFLTSLAVDQPLVILDYYGLRCLIENCTFRELKQGWHLGKFPKKSEDVGRGQVLLTPAIFTLTNVCRTDIGMASLNRSQLDPYGAILGVV
jgi:hypothetical protein